MKRNWVWGILLILVGLYFLLTELGVLTINLMYLLPLAVLAFIIYMQLQYFKEGCVDTGKPVLSGMLLGLAVIIFFCVSGVDDVVQDLFDPPVQLVASVFFPGFCLCPVPDGLSDE